MREIDFTHRRWGHNLTTICKDSSDGKMLYQCICTPGPELGDIAIAPDGSRWKFTEIDAMRNPPDLYHVKMDRQS